MTKNKPVFIYGLIDPSTAKIRYIGKSVNPKRRLMQHIHGRKDQKITPCSAWIKSVLKKGQEPEMMIIEETTQELWQERERFYIDMFRKSGENITNIADGGNQPSMTTEQRRLNAQVTNLKRDVSIWFILKRMAEAASRMEEIGNIERAKYFRMVSKKIKNAKGETLEKLKTYARKFTYA